MGPFLSPASRRRGGFLAEGPMTPLLDNFFNPAILAQYWPSILGGFWLTVEVALLTIAVGVLTGLLKHTLNDPLLVEPGANLGSENGNSTGALPWSRLLVDWLT